MTATTSHGDIPEAHSPAPTTAEAWKGFESLASETILSIVTQLPDLVSLDSLLRASPVCFRLFDEYAVEIFEAILSSGFTHGHISAMIRIIAFIRSSTLPIHGLDEFKKKVTHEAMNHRIRPSKDGFVPLDIPKDTPPGVLRSILATDRRIMCLAIDCIKIHLGRFKVLRPQQLVDKRFCFKTNLSTNPELGYVPAWESRPRGKKVTIRHSGPPSWVEEQRVIRALWRVQILTDLKKATARSLLNWPKGDIDVVNSMDPVDLYIGYDSNTYFGYHPEIEEINTVIKFVQERPRYSYSISSDDDSRKQLSPPPQEFNREWPAPIPCDKDCPFKEDRTALTSPTYGYFFYFCAQCCRLSRNVRYVSNEYSPLKYISFDPFRRLGFAIWSTQRMSRYGLVRRRDNRISDDFFYFTWLSILNESEIAEVEQGSKAFYIEMLPVMAVEQERYMRDLESRGKLKDYELLMQRRLREHELRMQEKVKSDD
jgi:hypothetical protein